MFDFGYSPLGTTYPAEMGTATIREDIARILHDRTGGLVRVDLAGWTGKKKQIVEGMFIGRGGGNPRHKAPLESLHNLLHNKMAALPGQTGPDVERRPEQLHGMLTAQEELMGIAKMLTPWQAEQLQYPLLEYSKQFLPRARCDDSRRSTSAAATTSKVGTSSGSRGISTGSIARARNG